MASEVADAAEASRELLASFPNLLGLGQLDAPEADWGTSTLTSLPPEAKTGVLANGLTWIVHENREPKARAELFLVVGFGSLVEEEEERGIAHIIEHLGFSATKAYENHAIVKFLESIGAPFGACQNAYTSFDRTVYTLHVPTDKEGIVPEALTVLREFAFFTRISEDDLDKERKVVLEEWRESKNAQGRLFEDYIKALCKGCKWCERLPIGKEEVIRGVSSETLRKFYSRFYHPARMSVVAVGDFDGEVVIKKIKELFEIAPGEISPLPRAAEAPTRPIYAVPDTPGVVVASSTDPELSYAQGMLDCKRPRQGSSSIREFRRRLAEDLFHKSLSSRLLKLTLEPKGPRNFFAVSTETGEPIPTLNPMSISLSPLPGRMRPALKTVAEEIERVKRMGFHEAEVRRAKRSILAEYEEQYIERDQRPSESIAEEYVSLFLDGVPAPGIEEQARVAATLLPRISMEEVMQVAKEYDFSRNVVVKIATPPLSAWNPLYSCWSIMQSAWHLTLPRPRMDLPDSKEVADLLKSVEQQHLEPWPEDEDDVDTRLRRKFEEVAERRLSPGGGAAPSLARVVRFVDSPGVPQPKRGTALEVKPAVAGEAYPMGEEVVLQNGMRIFLKSTDLFDAEVIVRARRWGGLSEHISAGGMLGGSALSCEAQTCSMVAMMLGICGLSMESLQECLDGRRVQPSPPGMDAYTTGLDCSASPTDLEVLLTLMHLLFLCPVEAQAKSSSRLSLVKLGLLAWRLGENRDPQAQFGRRVQKCITQDHPYTRLPSLWSILRLNFSKAGEIFNESVRNPRDWTFVLVGKLPAKDVLLPMLETYLGSIPNRSEGPNAYALGSSDVQREIAVRQAVKPLEIKFPLKIVREEVHLKMVDPKGSTLVVFPLQLSAVTQAGSVESAEAELREIFRLRLLVRMLETRLIEVLRFKRGQVYSVSVADDLSHAPPHLGCRRTGTVSIGFECDPAEADELIEATTTELSRLRSGEAAFTAENASAALEQERREFEELFHKNDWWACTILDMYFSRCHAVTGDIGASVALWWRIRADVAGTFDSTQASATLREVLPEGATSAVVTMRPKGKVPQGGAEDQGDEEGEEGGGG